MLNAEPRKKSAADGHVADPRLNYVIKDDVGEKELVAIN